MELNNEDKEYIRTHLTPLKEEALKELFDEATDSTHEDAIIHNMSFSPSNILKSVDPIAYNETFLGWIEEEVWSSGYLVRLQKNGKDLLFSGADIRDELGINEVEDN